MNNLQKRLFDYGIGILVCLRQIPRNQETMVIRNQLMRSATSPGAVYEEAQGAVTRPDFHNKINCRLKEIRESRYWLQVLAGLGYGSEQLEGLIQETNELIRIFNVISKKTEKLKTTK